MGGGGGGRRMITAAIYKGGEWVGGWGVIGTLEGEHSINFSIYL